MPSETQIISEIENTAHYYPGWTIGLTDDPVRRRREHDNPISWYYWDAVLESSARTIERYFLDKGMNGASGGGIYPHYVYIFM